MIQADLSRPGLHSTIQTVSRFRLNGSDPTKRCRSCVRSGPRRGGARMASYGKVVGGQYMNATIDTDRKGELALTGGSKALSGGDNAMSGGGLTPVSVGLGTL